MDTNNNDDYVILDRMTLKTVSEDGDRANLNYLQKVYKYLRAINATKSQHLFSVDYLGKGQDYLSAMVSLNREPSINSVSKLLNSLSNLKESYEFEDNKQAEVRVLDNLMNEGQRLLVQRLTNYIY